MSASFSSSVELPIQDGVGTVGFAVYNADGELVTARSTVGVNRLFEGADYAIYQVRITVASGITAGIVIWDDAAGNAVDKPFFIGTDNSGAVTVGSYDSTLDYEWGGSTADSYVSLATAEDLLLSYVLDKLDWDGAAGRTKDAALRMATRQLDAFTFLGTRRIYTQALKFPRWFNYPGRIDRTEDQVKADIQLATSIQASYLVRQGGRDAHAEALNAGIRQSSESVGPIRDQFTYTGGGAPLPLCTDAIRIIGPYRGMRQIFRS